MDVLEEKEHGAREIIREALSDVDRLFVIYKGDRPGLVLLHMLRTAGDGSTSIPVVNLQFLPIPGGALRFMDKLKRMWALELDVFRFHEKPDGGRYTEDEIAREAALVLCVRGAKRVLTSCTAAFEGGACSGTGQGHVEFRPLSGFSGEDIAAYAERHKLPACSANFEERDAMAAMRAEDTGNKELADRLRKLGYL